MKNNKWMFFSIIGIVFICALGFLFFNLQIKSAAPTIGDVLTKGEKGERAFLDPWQLNFALMGLLMVSFVALSVQSIRKPKCNCANLYAKVTAESEPDPMEDELRQLKLEQEETHRKHAKTITEKTDLEKEIKKYEDIIHNMLGNEEVLKKSNEALCKKFDRLVAEKENLVLEINRKNWELQESQKTPPLPEEAKKEIKEIKNEIVDQQERKAVEDLIKEVDEIIKQQNSTPVKTRKLKKKKNLFNAAETMENSNRKRVKK